MIPPAQLQMVVNNIGLPPGGINLAYSASDTTSNGDGDVLVLLAAKHRPTQEWMQVLREDFAQKFPQDTFFFEPADITNQTLNFGLPAPIDVQVRGKDAASRRRSPNRCSSKSRMCQVPWTCSCSRRSMRPNSTSMSTG